eukprot:g38568.t1
MGMAWHLARTTDCTTFEIWTGLFGWRLWEIGTQCQRNRKKMSHRHHHGGDKAWFDGTYSRCQEEVEDNLGSCPFCNTIFLEAMLEGAA